MHPGLLFTADRFGSSHEFIHRHDLVHLHADLMSRRLHVGYELCLLFLRSRGYRKQQGDGALPSFAFYVPTDVADSHGHLIINNVLST